MFSASVQIALREIRLTLGRGSNYGLPLAFFLILVIIFPFAMGPQPLQLALAGPAVLWAGPVLGLLLAIDRIFQNDQEDGTLDLYRLSGLPASLLIVAKAVAVWLVNAMPLILAAPFFGMMLNMEADLILGTFISLLVGTPALAFWGVMGAAITSTASRASLLLAVLIVPFLIPTVIFGVSSALGFADDLTPFKAPFLFLAACSLFSIALAPLAGAAALKNKAR